ncbi:MAG: biopolymer transporter ExbD [Polyangiaceae bacterium]
MGKWPVASVVVSSFALVSCAPSTTPTATPAPIATVAVEPAPQQEPPPAESDWQVTTPIELPRSSDVVDGAMSQVLIPSQGALMLDGLPVPDLEALSERAREIAAVDDHRGVVILADRDVAYRRVVEVIDAMKRGGLERFALGVSVVRP